jgi:hypothetical protein
MSFTRFHDDPHRIMKQLQESTDPGRYALNVPGNGDKPCFMEDPCIRIQTWGANLMTNAINLESELRGLNRNLNRDCLGNVYNSSENQSICHPIEYPSCAPFVDDSRATHPAWMFRDLEQSKWEDLPIHPQENVCMRFQNNLSTRILEKDSFIPKLPCVQ